MPDSPARLTVAVVSHMYPQRTREGYGVFVSEQVRALAAADAAVTCVAVPVPWAPWPLSALSPTWKRYASAERQRTDFGIVPVRFPRYLSFPKKALRGYSADSAVRAIVSDSVLAEGISGADVMIAHSALLDGRIAQQLSERYGVPYVVIVHGEDLYQNVDDERLRASVSAVLGHAAAIVSVSDALARGLGDVFGTLPPVHVVHNGVDTDTFAPPAVRPPASGGLHLLSASHLVERKAHEYVLRALATLADRGVDATLTIAGDGPRRVALEALVGELGLSEQVTFLGAYRHEELPALLRECDLFVMPSWDEAFGVVYLEALATGVPVLAATDGGAPEIVDEGVDGFLVPPRDSARIAEKIAAFSALGADAREAMREAARAKAMLFTWDANARVLLGILDGVVRRASARTSR